MKVNKIMDFSFLDAQTCNLLEEFESFKDHNELTERLKKTLYYGNKLPPTPRPSLPLTEVTVDLFSKAVPRVHLDVLDIHYAASISKKASLSPCSLMLALMYLERLRLKNPQYLQKVSSCDLFLVSMMVASKYLSDDADEGGVFNDEWAESAGVDLKDLNRLERDFLSAMEWELFVKPATFFDFLAEVETSVARLEGSKRSWLTYTEISILVQRLRSMQTLLEDFSKVMIVSGIAYVSAVVTLLAATTLALKCCALIPSSIQLSCCMPTDNNWQLLLDDTTTTTATLQASNRSVICGLPTIPCSIDDRTAITTDRQEKVPIRLRNGAPPSDTVFGLELWRLIQASSPSVWDTFKYWPTCCGPPHSGFI